MRERNWIDDWKDIADRNPNDPWEARAVIELIEEIKTIEKKLVIAREAVSKIPSALLIEDIAKAWTQCDRNNRSAQHFYEGAIWMRSFILKALAEIDKEKE